MNKRFVVTLLAVVMIFACVSALTACNDEHTHSWGEWTSDSANTHSRTCACGETETKEHSFGSWTTDDEQTHSHSCGMCGQKEALAHNFVNGVCIDCGDKKPAKNVTVSLNYNGATGGNTQKTIVATVDEKLGALPTPTKDGYKFLGWQLDGATVTAETVWQRYEDDIELVAKWKNVAPTEGLTYKLNDDNVSYTVTGWGTATDTDIVIPSTYNNKPVTSIAGFAFRGRSDLTSITIPNSVTDIGDRAFDGCSNIKEVYISDIASWCGINFADSQSNPLFFAGSLYINGEFVTELIIPDNVTSLGNYAFFGCGSLTSITIPDSVTTLGDEVFFNCRSLTSVTIGKGVTSIGEATFTHCLSLIEVFNKSSLDITAGSEDYGGVGYYVKNVYTPTIGESKLMTDENGFVIYDGNTLVKYVGTATEIEIPSSIITIYQNAFCAKSNLTKVTIPNSVASIEDFAFFGCSNLTSVTIPHSVTSIGHGAFQYCSSLTGITIGKGVTNIGDGVFYDCGSLTKIEVAEENAKYSDDGNCLIEVESKTLILGCNNSIIPTDGSITSIGDCAFYHCSNLTNITIPDSITSIGRYAFYDCTNLQYNEFDNALYLGNEKNPYVVLVKAKNQSITSCVVNENTKFIYADAFSDCNNLTSITIPDSVTDIGESAFFDCSSLTSISIPDSVASIGGYAFYGCGSLTSITIGNGIKKIDYWAFSEVPNLAVVYYKGTEEEWKSIDIEIFQSDLNHAARYYYSETEPAVDSDCFYWHYDTDGVTPVMWTIRLGYKLSSDGQSYIVTSMGNVTDTDIVIPSTFNNKPVTSIAAYAFCFFSDLTSITIPDSVTSIGEYAFCDCINLTTIIIGKELPTIGNDAFTGCNNLEKIYYKGSADDWNNISGGDYNLAYAPHYYYSETEPALNSNGTAYNDNYWHYDTDGITPIVWVKEN